jgi:hypothetical protein
MVAPPDEAGTWGPNALKVDAFQSQLRAVVGA